MKIAIISTYTHPTRRRIKEPSLMQSAVPELIAGLCPPGVEIELYNEKERDIPEDRDWDLVFFSYLHAYYEHTKVLSAKLRRRGVFTVAGGRHATYYKEDAARHFDAVIAGQPEANVPALLHDFERGEARPLYELPPVPPAAIRPYRYDLIDFTHNRVRLPGIEASRGCPFACNFCVLTGHERYVYRPIAAVIDDITRRMRFNQNSLGFFDRTFIFLDNNLGGSPKYLRELCEALLPLGLTWGCALTFNVLRDESLVRLMGRAGCRYIYTGLESLNPASIEAMNKGQNRLREIDAVIRRVYQAGILLSFGLIVGADGDTNEYLERIPEYLAELRYHAITFLGIVCPYPETPFFRQLQAEGRLLPGTISRDYDGYTLCHRPRDVAADELVEHYKRLCTQLASPMNLARHLVSKLFLSDLPRYKQTILASAPEIRSIKNPIMNRDRRYIAGEDPIEPWDAQEMLRLGLAPQYITPLAGDTRGGTPPRRPLRVLA